MKSIYIYIYAKEIPESLEKKTREGKKVKTELKMARNLS